MRAADPSDKALSPGPSVGAGSTLNGSRAGMRSYREPAVALKALHLPGVRPRVGDAIRAWLFVVFVLAPFPVRWREAGVVAKGRSDGQWVGCLSIEVPGVAVEPTRPVEGMGDFKSPASAIPPPGPRRGKPTPSGRSLQHAHCDCQLLGAGVSSDVSWTLNKLMKRLSARLPCE